MTDWMLEVGGGERGEMVISHCDGNREREHIWSKTLSMMGDAWAAAGGSAQMAVEAIIVAGASP